MHALALEAPPPACPTGHADPLAVVRRYLEAATELLAREGLTVTVRRDMAAWAGIVRAGPKNAGVNPTFDPDCTGPHDDAFWVEIRDAETVVAVAASRLILCEGYYDHVRAGLLWSRPPGRAVDILIDEPGFSGPMAHSGGLWVHPAARGSGLSWIVPRFNQAVSQLVWPIRDVASVIFRGVHDSGLPATYGAHCCRPLIDGHFWPTGRNELIYSAEYPGSHLVMRAQWDLDLLHDHGDKKMRDLAAMIREWNRQPAVRRAAAV